MNVLLWPPFVVSFYTNIIFVSFYCKAHRTAFPIWRSQRLNTIKVFAPVFCHGVLIVVLAIILLIITPHSPSSTTHAHVSTHVSSGSRNPGHKPTDNNLVVVEGRGIENPLMYYDSCLKFLQIAPVVSPLTLRYGVKKN